MAPSPMGTFMEHLICTTWHSKVGNKEIHHFLADFEVAPHAFLFCWKSTSWYLCLLRLHHIVSFFTENPWVSTFAHWGCTTHLPFSLKICKLAPFVLRLHHTPSFFDLNPQVGTFSHWGHATQFPFLVWCHCRRGGWYCLKRYPMCIFVPKRHPMQANIWATAAAKCK